MITFAVSEGKNNWLRERMSALAFAKRTLPRALSVLRARGGSM